MMDQKEGEADMMPPRIRARIRCYVGTAKRGGCLMLLVAGFLLALLLLALAGCQADQERVAGIHYATDTFTAQQIADHDVVVVRDWLLFQDSRYAGLVDSVKAINSDCVVLGYVPIWHLHWWVIEAAEAGGHEWGEVPEYLRQDYQAMKPFIFTDDQGQHFAPWVFPGGHPEWAVNILDPFCVEARAANLAEWLRASKNLQPGTGIFLDWMGWQIPAWAEYRNLDLDGNGILHWDDIKEKEALHDAYLSMILHLRASLPEWVVIIANGDVPPKNQKIRELLDGCMIETGGLMFGQYKAEKYIITQGQKQPWWQGWWQGQQPIILLGDMKHSAECVAIAQRHPFFYGVRNPRGYWAFIPREEDASSKKEKEGQEEGHREGPQEKPTEEG